ncbi:MAG TPA: NADPH:quinone reductase [Blastocatellia bacterium]
MKAIRVHEFGGPEVMQLEEIPDLTPAAGEAVVRVRAIGVNPVDTYIRSGQYPAKPTLPYTPGSDAAGVVDSVGKAVTRVRTGDSVYVAGTLSGAYAHQALCSESQVHRLPSHITFEQGAAVGIPYATAYRALFQRAAARPGETVLVHGATGGVGIAAVQLARAAGLRVIGTGGTESGRANVVEQGANHVLDHHAANYLEEITELTRGNGVDVVLELLANVNLAKDLAILAKRGRVVVIGSRGTIEIDPRATMTRDTSILGMSLMNTTDEERVSIHSALVAGLENGTLRPIVGREIPLADAARAHAAVMEPGAYGKIVLIP